MVAIINFIWWLRSTKYNAKKFEFKSMRLMLQYFSNSSKCTSKTKATFKFKRLLYCAVLTEAESVGLILAGIQRFFHIMKNLTLTGRWLIVQSQNNCQVFHDWSAFQHSLPNQIPVQWVPHFPHRRLPLWSPLSHKETLKLRCSNSQSTSPLNKG